MFNASNHDVHVGHSIYIHVLFAKVGSVSIQVQENIRLVMVGYITEGIWGDNDGMETENVRNFLKCI